MDAYLSIYSAIEWLFSESFVNGSSFSHVTILKRIHLKRAPILYNKENN
jgi:hypothetical protein